jgi:hypothetical protein
LVTYNELIPKTCLPPKRNLMKPRHYIEQANALWQPLKQPSRIGRPAHFTRNDIIQNYRNPSIVTQNSRSISTLSMTASTPTFVKYLPTTDSTHVIHRHHHQPPPGKLTLALFRFFLLMLMQHIGHTQRLLLHPNCKR